MFIYSQDNMCFVNSKNISGFSVLEVCDMYEIYADDYKLGEYLNQNDAMINLQNIFKQIDAGSTSYQV